MINADIFNRKIELQKKLIDAQMKGIALTAKDLKNSFRNKTDLHNIFDFVDQYSQNVKNKREESTIENYKKHMKKLELFHGSKTLSFEEITPEYLRRYENHLRKTVGANYTHALFKTLKTFFNAAKRRGLITCYPFPKYDNPVYKAPVKEYLSLLELESWEKFADETTNHVHKQAAVYFLLGCYSGLRISDWKRFDHKKIFTGNRLKLYAKKEWRNNINAGIFTVKTGLGTD